MLLNVRLCDLIALQSGGMSGSPTKCGISRRGVWEGSYKKCCKNQVTEITVCRFNSSKVLPLAAFQSSHPLAERPMTAKAAMLGLENK